MRAINIKRKEKRDGGVTTHQARGGGRGGEGGVRDGEECENYVHCALLGDGKVGKTCLTLSFTQRLFCPDYTATVFDNYPVPVQVGGEKFVISLFDTRGHTNHESLRAFAYDRSEVLVLCFSLCDRQSFYNVVNRWLPEVRRHNQHRRLPLLLVGTQKDLRDSRHPGSGQTPEEEEGGLCENSGQKTENVFREACLRQQEQQEEDFMQSWTTLEDLSRFERWTQNAKFRLSSTGSDMSTPEDDTDDEENNFNLHLFESDETQRQRERDEDEDEEDDVFKQQKTPRWSSCRKPEQHQRRHQQRQKDRLRESDLQHQDEEEDEEEEHQEDDEALRQDYVRWRGTNSCSDGERPDMVSTEEGQQLGKIIGADCYIECSAKSQEGLQEVFQHIVFSGLKYRVKKSKSCRLFSRLFGGNLNLTGRLKSYLSSHLPRISETPSSCMSC